MNSLDKLKKIIQEKGIELPYSPLLLEIAKESFNLGLEIAADEGIADHIVITHSVSGDHIEAYIIKNSILMHKL